MESTKTCHQKAWMLFSDCRPPWRDNHFFTFRNAFLEKKGLALPKAVKTGTTIAGLVYEDGVILGADTRATEGMIVADKNCEKIHYIAPNI